MIKCKDTGESVNTYKEYLLTKHWLKRKADYLRKHKKECTMCGNKYYIQVHHVDYKNLGDEKDEDLVALCKRCHDKLHKNISKATDSKVLSYISKMENARKDKIKEISCDCTLCRKMNRNNCCELYGYMPNKNKCKYYDIVKERLKNKKRKSKK